MTAGAESASGPAQRRLVLVAGIGRSGTSVFTGILAQLGFRVPQPEVQADATNPRGFGEPRWVVDFHMRLLRERLVTVWDSRPAAWSQMAETALGEAAYNELRAWLAVQFVGCDQVVVKDPRIGWFLPLWRRCAEDLEVSTSFVTMLRPPAEVLNSARKWYGTWQNDASRASAWLNMMLETERATRGSPRAFVRHSDILADWPREIERVGRALDLPSLQGLDRAALELVDEFVDPGLHRSKVTWEDVPVPARVRAMVDDVWDQFSRLADVGGDDDDSRAGLDAARSAYVQMYADAEAIAQSSVTVFKRKQRAAAAAAPEPAPTAARASSKGAKSAKSSAPLARRVIRRIPERYRRRVPPRWRRRVLQITSKVGARHS